MNKTSALAACLCLGAVIGLTGCKNNDNRAYDDVGEQRVFDNSHSIAAKRGHTGGLNESVPAPQPLAKAHRGNKQYAKVGELDMAD
jgi:hypothetical protein